MRNCSTRQRSDSQQLGEWWTWLIVFLKVSKVAAWAPTHIYHTTGFATWPHAGLSDFFFTLVTMWSCSGLLCHLMCHAAAVSFCLNTVNSIGCCLSLFLLCVSEFTVSYFIYTSYMPNIYRIPILSLLSLPSFIAHSQNINLLSVSMNCNIYCKRLCKRKA